MAFARPTSRPAAPALARCRRPRWLPALPTLRV